MKKITLEVQSWLRLGLDLKTYPELTSRKRFIRKGIHILRTYTPGLLRYLSRQQVFANLDQYEIEIETRRKTAEKRVRNGLTEEMKNNPPSGLVVLWGVMKEAVLHPPFDI